MPSEATQAFRSARDFLLAHRDDYSTAYAGFQWPKLDRFNWALDWFDQIATGDRRNQTALWVAYEDGRQDKLTFAELSERSNRIANYFRSLGVRRSDRVLLMLGNIPPLWETMLAMMKLGAVIIPATTLLTADDLADRIARGHVRHIICAADLAPKIDAACGSCTRVAIAGCGVTTFCAPPTVWRMLITESLSDWKVRLRELASAGEPLNPEVIEQVRTAWGLTIRDGYGQTETTAQVGNPPGQKLKIGAMGRPLPGYPVRLLDANEKDAAEGELCLPLDPPPAALWPGYQ